ncbi:MAG: AAA family ATPase, partial [Planctomycetota bacterium]
MSRQSYEDRRAGRPMGRSAGRSVGRNPLGCVVAGLTLVCLLSGGPVRAQSDRDAEFAEILLRSDYLDLAELEARRIESEARYGTTVRGDAGYLLVQILKQKARVTQGSEKQAILDEVGKLIEELAQKYPSHSQSSVADLERLQARLSEAEAFMSLARDGEEGADEKREQAVAIYKEVTESFDAVIASIADRLKKVQKDGDRSALMDMMFKRDLAEYLRANAYFTYGQALNKDASDRTELLEKAHELFSNFFDDRGMFFNLSTLSYIGRGKAEIELGRFEDAMMTFEEAQYIEARPSGDPAHDRQQETFVKDIQTEATYWMINASVAAGQHEKGIEGFEMLKQQLPEYLDTHFGKIAVFEYAKALAAKGRLRAAGDAIDLVLQRSMKSAGVLPGYDIDRYGVSACKALADIYATSTGFFPAPLQYRAGQGFFFKRDFEGATYALKGVLASSASDEERQVYGPKALSDLGAAYEYIGRPYESALAYQGLYRMFPECDQANSAMRNTKRLFAELAAKDAWYRTLSDEVTRDQQELLSGVGAE